MKIVLSRLLLLCSVLCLFSCAGQPLPTLSGRPEVTVKPPMSRVQNAVMRAMATGGYTLTNQSANALTFEKEMTVAQSVMVLAAVGNSSYSQPKTVIQYTFTPTGDGIRVFANAHAVTQSPFGQVSTLDITSGDTARDLQKALEILKQRMAQK